MATPLYLLLVLQVTQRGHLQVRNARVGNVELPNQKRIEYSLQYIFGIGHPTAIQILSDTVNFQSDCMMRLIPQTSSW